MRARARVALAEAVTRWRRHACERQARARWLAAGGTAGPLPRPEARSQFGEDALLWDLLGDRRKGFFVEAGAYDGYTFSVSYIFECAGWSGLLIEPLADRAAECARRRPASRVVTAALSRPGAPATAAVTRVPWFEMYSGFEPTDPTRGFADADPSQLSSETTAVLTLDHALEGHHGAIDFVVLDVEGHELAALEGLDLERWRAAALLVENNTGDEEALRGHVTNRGYTYVASLEQNDLFVNPDSLARRLPRYWFNPGPLVRH